MRTTEADRGQRIISGRVNADGTVAAGTGFQVAKAATGSYTIRFVPPLRSASAAVANTHGNGVGYAAQGQGLTGQSVGVLTYGGGIPADVPFAFEVVGTPL